MAEITGAAGRCPHAAGRVHPGHVGLGAAAAGTLAGGWPTRYGSRQEKARRRGYPQLHNPWHLPLTSRLSWVFARMLRSLMHTLLSWQLKKPQTGTSEHELKERACHIALSALLREWAGGDPHELRLLARRSRPGVRSTRPGPYVGPTLRRNPDMFSMAVAAMRRHRITAAAALAAVLIAPGAAAAAAAAPAAQASVAHPARTGGFGGSRAGNA